MKKNILKTFGAATAAIAIALAIQSTASAQTIINPVSVTASSAIGGFAASQILAWNSTYPFNGLSTPTPDLSATQAPQTFADGFWISGLGQIAGETLTFDLGSAQDVAKAYLWQFNQRQPGGLYDATNRGIQNFTVTGYDPVAGIYKPLHTGTFTLQQANSSLATPNSAEAFTFTQNNLGIQFVRINIASNYGSTEYVGLGEARFTAVPEPATWALLAGGLTTLMVLRRRKA